jgi:hypothetical protein
LDFFYTNLEGKDSATGYGPGSAVFVFGTGSHTVKVGVFPTRKLLSCLKEAAGEDEVKREKEKDIVLFDRKTGDEDGFSTAAAILHKSVCV